MRAVMLGLLLAGAWLAAPIGVAAYSVQEAILRVKPAVVLITTEVSGDVTLNCGSGPVTVSPAPYIETGTGWFVDGRGYVIPSAHVVDPADRLPRWVTHELKKKAVDQACVEPQLKKRGLIQGQRPDIEERLRLASGALASAKLETQSQITVMLSNGVKLKAEVQKFSPPPSVDSTGKATPDSGRDLALLRVPEGIYPAIGLTTREVQIGDPVHILGFPGLLFSHELLNQNVTLEASATNGAVSGFKMNVINQDLIQTDAPAAHGNSGGPAITDDATLVGVMQFVSLSASGANVQGFNFLIPARDVDKFLRGTEVTKPGDSKFNPVWAAGVELLLAQRYKAALAKISEANQLVPNLTDVKHSLALAREKVKNPPPEPFNFEPEQMIITYCTSPEEQQSARVAQILRQRGFKTVRILKGGLGGWTNARLPVEAKSALPSVGLELYKNLSLGDIERRRFKRGDVIFKEGDDAHDEAYVIHAGEVEIRRSFDGVERVVNRIGEGQPLGEIGLFRKGPRSATAIAAEDVELLIIKEERLEWLIRNRPQLALELLKRLSNLVVATDQERAHAGGLR